MKTTLFLSVSIDGYIADKNGIPMFPEGAWEDWCSLVNETGNVIGGRTSFEQLKGDEMAAMLHPEHTVVMSTRDFDLSGTNWHHAKTAREALDILKNKGVKEALVGGGRAVAHSFMKENLIDNFVIDLQPVVFGVGVPLFGDEINMTQLKLIESRPLNDSAIRFRYEVLK